MYDRRLSRAGTGTGFRQWSFGASVGVWQSSKLRLAESVASSLLVDHPDAI